MPSLILLRGLPGAGKTTLARLLAGEKFPLFSIDDYFTHPQSGDYAFEFDKNHLAYAACRQNVEEAMKTHAEKIFVHNTFTLEWEMEPYFKLASEFGYRVFVVTVENRHGGGNCHGISHDQLTKMAGKYRVVLL